MPHHCHDGDNGEKEAERLAEALHALIRKAKHRAGGPNNLCMHRICTKPLWYPYFAWWVMSGSWRDPLLAAACAWPE